MTGAQRSRSFFAFGCVPSAYVARTSFFSGSPHRLSPTEGDGMYSLSGPRSPGKPRRAPHQLNMERSTGTAKKPLCLHQISLSNLLNIATSEAPSSQPTLARRLDSYHRIPRRPSIPPPENTAVFKQTDPRGLKIRYVCRSGLVCCSSALAVGRCEPMEQVRQTAASRYRLISRGSVPGLSGPLECVAPNR